MFKFFEISVVCNDEGRKMKRVFKFPSPSGVSSGTSAKLKRNYRDNGLGIRRSKAGLRNR